jgi:hypothetical protein
MTPEQMQTVRDYVNSHVDDFHNGRIASIKALKLKTLLEKKNPYMFRTKDLRTPEEFVEPLLQSHISSSEESLFGGFMEGLAIYISDMFQHTQKKPAPGLDMSFVRDNIHYLVGIKSGNSWGNSEQHKQLREGFKNAVKTLKQSKDVGQIESILGICYGKVRSTHNGLYRKICGQEFWEFISGDPGLYLDIIEPLGYEAKKHNEAFEIARAATRTRFVHEFTEAFCDEDFSINWETLVKFNSGKRAPRVTSSKHATQSRKPKVTRAAPPS